MSVPSLAPLATAAGEGRVASAPTGKSAWLRCVWLNEASAPAERMAFPLMSSLSLSPSVTGEVRTFSGGVDVAFSRPGKRTPVKVELPHCTQAQIAWLEARIGRVVCVRNDRGRRLFGIYWSVPITDNPHNLEAATSLDLAQVTFPEAV